MKYHTRFSLIMVLTLLGVFGGNSHAEPQKTTVKVVPVPTEPAPVKKAGIEYRAPHISVSGSQPTAGYVEARDEKSGALLWSRRIYFLNPAASTDTAHVYITSLKIKGNSLVVTDELGNKFKMDLKTRDVTHVGK